MAAVQNLYTVLLETGSKCSDLTVGGHFVLDIKIGPAFKYMHSWIYMKVQSLVYFETMLQD